MNKFMKLAFFAVFLIGAVQMGFSRGDKVIPQIVDGPDWITKFDITNISRLTRIQNMRIVFYKNDGSVWNLQTRQGATLRTGEIRLDLQPRQTTRIETVGATPGGGYAIVYDEETDNSTFSEDFVLGISVFYVYSDQNGVVDTVTVSVPQPTAAANVPMEMNFTKQTYSGLALINPSKTDTQVTVDLYSEAGSALDGGSKTFTLKAGAQFAGFLDNAQLFSTLFASRSNYKGMAQITSGGPLVILALLQTQGYSGPQYSTLAAVDRESLRRNSYMVLLQFPDVNNPYLPMDLDAFTVDYSRTAGEEGKDTETYSWDLMYEYNGTDPTARQIKAVVENGAALAPIGVRDGPAFDLISLPTLKGLAYTTGGIIDLNPRSSSLQEGFTFAVRTDTGNYAKVRILRIIQTTVGSNTNYRDLLLEVCIYK